MPRRPRAEFEPGVHHVYARGNNKEPIFVDDRDRLAYLGLLAQVASDHGWRCLSYCLMGNHVHLLVETTEPNLGAGIQRIHGAYAQGFNRRHGRSGHLFQGRFGSTRIEDDAQLWMTVAYIARNPVEAGLCGAPEEWVWSSHAAMLDGGTPAWLDKERLLGYLGGAAGGDPATGYARCVGGGASGAGNGAVRHPHAPVPPHVLLADDALGFRFALKATLESHGAGSVTVCQRWSDVPAVAAEEQPDAIILDLLMPTFDVEALKATRAAAPDAVLAVISSYSREDAQKRLEEGGVSGIDLVFSKAERPAEIADTLLARVTPRAG